MRRPLILLAVAVVAFCGGFARASSSSAAKCGVVTFPNKTLVDLTSFSGTWSGALFQEGDDNDRFQWAFAPCSVLCNSSSASGSGSGSGSASTAAGGQISQALGSNACNVLLVADSSPHLEGDTIVATYTGSDFLNGFTWHVKVVFQCRRGVKTYNVTSPYRVSSSGTAVNGTFVTYSEAFCSVAPPTPGASTSAAAHPTGENKTNNSSSTGEDAHHTLSGGVVAAIVLLTLVALIAAVVGGLWWRRRSARGAATMSGAVGEEVETKTVYGTVN